MVTEHEIPDISFREDTATKLAARSGRKRDRTKDVRAPLDECIELVRELPEALGISEYKLARLMGISQSLIGQWKVGWCRPSQAYMARMIRIQVDAAKGLNLERVKTFDWITRKPIYYPGWGPSNE